MAFLSPFSIFWQSEGQYSDVLDGSIYFRPLFFEKRQNQELLVKVTMSERKVLCKFSKPFHKIVSRVLEYITWGGLSMYSEGAINSIVADLHSGRRSGSP